MSSHKSSNNNNNNNNERSNHGSPRRVITNPYAKKKTQPSATTSVATSSQQGVGGSSDKMVARAQPQAPRATTTNPYARKATSSSTSRANRSSPKQTGATASLPSLAPVEGATSFSQAFSAIEDTPHFQRALDDAQQQDYDVGLSNHTDNNQEERRQQRAMDAATTTATSATHSNKNDNTNNNIVQDYQNSNQLSDRQVQAALVGTSANPHVLYVSPKQRGNIVLEYVKNVPVTFLRMVPDYIFSTTQCALFLSLKYHSLYPNYIHRRIAELGHDFQLRVLLVLVDVQDNAPALLQLNALCVTNKLTLILAWTAEEAARYLETYKALHGKDASVIQKRTSTNYVDQVADFLTACPSVNKTDAANLLGQFTSLQALCTHGTPEELSLVTGMGHVKVTRLYEALHKPFSKRQARKRRLLRKEQEQQQQQAKRQKEPSADQNKADAS